MYHEETMDRYEQNGPATDDVQAGTVDTGWESDGARKVKSLEEEVPRLGNGRGTNMDTEGKSYNDLDTRSVESGGNVLENVAVRRVRRGESSDDENEDSQKRKHFQDDYEENGDDQVGCEESRKKRGRKDVRMFVERLERWRRIASGERPPAYRRRGGRRVTSISAEEFLRLLVSASPMGDVYF